MEIPLPLTMCLVRVDAWVERPSAVASTPRPEFKSRRGLSTSLSICLSHM